MIWLLRWSLLPLLAVLFLVSKSACERVLLFLRWPHTDITKEVRGLYLRRFYLSPPTRPRGRRVFLHHILRSDDDRDPHDHPWDYFTLILSNGYYENVWYPRSHKGHMRDFRVGSWAKYPAEHVHKLTLIREQPTWTLVVAGPTRRKWGFWIFGPNHTLRSDRWVDHVEYGAQGSKVDHFAEDQLP